MENTPYGRGDGAPRCRDEPLLSMDETGDARRSRVCEGSQLHGAPPERMGVWESRRIVAWGLILPALAIAAAQFAGPLSLALLLAYPLNVVRIARRLQREGESRPWTLAPFPDAREVPRGGWLAPLPLGQTHRKSLRDRRTQTRFRRPYACGNPFPRPGIGARWVPKTRATMFYHCPKRLENSALGAASALSLNPYRVEKRGGLSHDVLV
jgi:hypothetical protein